MAIIASVFIALATFATSIWVFDSLIVGPFVWLLAWSCCVVFCGKVE